MSSVKFVTNDCVGDSFFQMYLFIFVIQMSCHVIVRNRLSLSMGSRGVAAGANPSLVSGRGQGTPWTGRQLIAGPSLMSNVRFNILLKDTLTCSSVLPGAGI